LTPDNNSLRSAYYTLHVGKEYYRDERPYTLREGEKIEIPKNGLVYIQTLEWFNMPYYLIARYNLQVTQLYRGFLLDNGLQLDPGYHGHIYCAVHNLTNESKILKYKEKFIVMDFVRTTPLPTQRPEFKSIDNEESFVNQDIRGVAEKKIVFFAAKDKKKLLRRDRKVHEYWLQGEKHGSAMYELQMGFERLEKKEFPKYQNDINEKNQETASKVASLSKISIISIIGIIITLFIIIMTHFYWQERKFSNVNDKYEHVKNELAENVLTHVKKESAKELESTKDKIAVINKSLEDISSRQDISQESIKAIQDTLLKFENLFKQMESESSKSSEGLKSKSIELDTFSLDVEKHSR